MTKRGYRGPEITCEGVYWAKLPESCLRRLPKRNHKILELSYCSDHEEDSETSRSSKQLATSSLSLTQKQYPQSKMPLGRIATSAIAAMLKNQRSVLSTGLEPRVSEDFREELKEVMAEALEKEYEETEIKEAIAMFGDLMDKVIRDVRDEHQGVRRKPLSQKTTSQKYTKSFGSGSEESLWAPFTRNGISGGSCFHRLSPLFISLSRRHVETFAPRSEMLHPGG